jgi:hypothetical protein
MELPESMGSELKRSVLMASGGVGAIRDALDGKAQLQTLEPAEVDGKKVDVVRWTEGDQNVRLFIDPYTHRIVKAAYRSVTPQGASDVETIWTDFKETGGITVPGKSIQYRDGQKFSEATLKDVKFNVGIDPKTFAK